MLDQDTMREELPAARRRTEWLGRREACRPWWKAGSEGGSPLWKSSAGSSAAPAACEAEIRWGAAGRRRKRDLLDAPCRRRRPHGSAPARGSRDRAGGGTQVAGAYAAATTERSRAPAPPGGLRRRRSSRASWCWCVGVGRSWTRALESELN
jgi:hypothetical protein